MKGTLEFQVMSVMLPVSAATVAGLGVSHNRIEPVRYFLFHQFQQKSYFIPADYLRVFYGSQNKCRLLPYTALTDWTL